MRRSANETHAPHAAHVDRVLCGRRHARVALLVAIHGERPTCKHCDEIIRDTHEDLL